MTIDKTQQYYQDKLEILNGQAFDFYLTLKNKGYSDFQIRSEIWNSKIWVEAKMLFMDLNIFLYGNLTCEICFKGFYANNIMYFQLHHEDVIYYWEKLFNPETTHLIHKICHKNRHQIKSRPGIPK